MSSIKTIRIFFCAILLVLGSVLLFNRTGFSAANTVHVIDLDDATINPVTAEYIMEAIDRAAAAEAQCLVIRLDTPGGLLSSTRTIVKKMLSAKIPVVVYIAPAGARAGSAGVFLTYASHVAAMAPSTNIGAAHPVQMGQKEEQRNTWQDFKEAFFPGKESEESPQDSEEKKEETSSRKSAPVEKEEQEEDIGVMEGKILNDTIAFIKAIAKERNRNVEWAVASVTESESITAAEALEKNVVEIIAADTEDLLRQLNGRVVTVGERDVTLSTADADVVPVPMDLRQKILNILANPNIAYIFMILGFYGLLYEVTHPGFGVPGIMGLIFLILAFYAMQMLPTNYAGVALIALSVVLFITEAYVPGLGLLTLGGIVAMVLGSILLFDSPSSTMRVSYGLIIPLTGTTALITIFLVRLVLKTHKLKALTGQKGLIGETGVVREPINHAKEGKVFVHGELWNAVADEDITEGEKVEVTDIQGMLIRVRKSS
jgi:membrane-bound serine protease (ClpP class)